jgi:DNA-binding transcriptional regulator WhiA
MRGYFRKLILNEDKELQSYVIGLALGDGNLSNPNKRSIRLRITCDAKYPLLVAKIKDSLQRLFPQNKASISPRKDNYYNVSLYSNRLKEIIPWQVNKGTKFEQKACVPSWIKENKNYAINCLRGLIETDGAIYNDRGYKMMIFTSIIPTLAEDFYNMVMSLGFKPHIYKIKPKN